MPKHKPQVEKSQIAAFRKAARELGADESDEQFRKALRTVAKAKPSEKGKQRHTSRNSKD